MKIGSVLIGVICVVISDCMYEPYIPHSMLIVGVRIISNKCVIVTRFGRIVSVVWA